MIRRDDLETLYKGYGDDCPHSPPGAWERITQLVVEGGAAGVAYVSPQGVPPSAVEDLQTRVGALEERVGLILASLEPAEPTVRQVSEPCLSENLHEQHWWSFNDGSGENPRPRWCPGV